ncbi:uncharacterized protein BO87DRAFT_322964, partial [Aspergillus neoniger CBS 115656]
YLYIYINYLQDNWSSWLLLIKFILNIIYSDIIKIILFFTNYSFYFYIKFKSIPVLN